MADLKLNGVTLAVGKIKVGDTDVQKIYQGETLVWPTSTPGPGQVQICDLIWTDTNSSETELTAGGNLPILTNQTDWYNAWQAQTPAACYIDFDSNNSSYGLIYNYWGRLEVKKPPGFRLPTQSDYNTLTTFPCFTGTTLNRYGANPGVWDPSLLTDTTELGNSGFNSQGYGQGVFNFGTGVVTFPFFGLREAYWLGSIDASSKGFGFIVNGGSLSGLGYGNSTAWMLFIRFVKDA
jgi:hypothetical protein